MRLATVHRQNDVLLDQSAPEVGLSGVVDRPKGRDHRTLLLLADERRFSAADRQTDRKCGSAHHRFGGSGHWSSDEG